MTHGDEPYDVIIVGAGVAGSRLLAHLLRSPWRTRRILVVERDPPDARDHALAFWSAAPTDLVPLVTHRWQALQVSREGEGVVAPLRDHVYAATTRRALVDAALLSASACPNVQILRASVDEVRDGAERAEVRVGARWYRGTWVFDSRRPAPAPATVRLEQRFVGWTIEAAGLDLDPRTATLFDFRTERGGGASFIYVLPFSQTRALVEHVFVGRGGAPGPAAEAALAAYLAAHLDLRDGYRITARERGASALTDERRPSRRGRRIRAIGVRGGRLKPSSGYALTRIERDSAAMVRSLVERGDPFGGAHERRLYRWLDAIFLWALAREPERAPAIFTALMRRPDRTLRLLDERAGLADLLVLLVALPTLVFLRAALRWLMAARRIEDVAGEGRAQEEAIAALEPSPPPRPDAGTSPPVAQ